MRGWMTSGGRMTAEHGVLGAARDLLDRIAAHVLIRRALET